MNEVNLAECRLSMKKIILIFSLVLLVENVKAQNKSEVDKPVCELPALNIKPEFAGRDGNFIQFIYNHLQYPKKAKRKKTTGKVITSFIVEKDGNISEIIILNGLPNGCNEAVINLIKRLPKWRPAMENGKFIRFTYELQIEFGPENYKFYKNI